MAKSAEKSTPSSNSETRKIGPKKINAQLRDLLLDVDNPRFGGLSNEVRDQADVLDHIVNTFGVDDLLSSLSVNGYFEAEPLVVRDTKEGLVVAEGNRRLAACLMLSGDDRAYRQKEKASSFIKAWGLRGRPALDPVPVIVFSGEGSKRELLSYLGVRHISSSKSWDSFAKAAWVADVVDQHGLPVRDIAVMIGDQHRTIERLLQGFYLVNQLVEEGEFRPSDSLRSGRGSVTDYPFSWVYTILGYAATQRYLEIASGTARPNPLEHSNLKRGGVLMRAMFGDKKIGRNSAVNDSRQLGTLASMLVNPETLTLVEQGKNVDEIRSATQDIDERLRLGIANVREVLRDLVARMDEVEVAREVAASMISPAEKTASLSISLLKKLQVASVASSINLDLPGLEAGD
ncbi:hypothetical protein ACW7G2_00725 [Luteimonas sp. A277]